MEEVEEHLYNSVPRHRRRGVEAEEDDRWFPAPDSCNPDLPYGGKVLLARRKKPDPWWLSGILLSGLALALTLCYYSYYYSDNLGFHVHNIYAYLGHTESKHGVGQRYLQGIGTSKDYKRAMQWFQKAADDGHPEASFNLAVAHLKGHRKLAKGEAPRLIKHAASNGVRQADQLLRDVCSRRSCD